MSLTEISFARIGERKIFHELDGDTCVKTWESNVLGLRKSK